MDTFPNHIIVLGRFPPPPDGQSVATNRLADYLESVSTVHRINAMIPAEASPISKVQHYRAIGKKLDAMLASQPEAPILWTSISPEIAGHFRDVATVFPRLKNRTVIAVAHWGKFASVFENAATRRTARHLLPGLNKIVYTAPLLSEACSPWVPAHKRAVIPNTLDAALIPDSQAVKRRIERGPSQIFKVLFLSNMIREKGWEDLLDAAAILGRGKKEFEWVFVGGWPKSEERSLFDEKVRQLGLTNSVSHRGLLRDRTAIAKEHLAADLFVLPSWLREAQPISIMEAMAAGTPCIVADDGGMPDMIGAHSDSLAGIVVKPQQPEGLAAAIERLSEPEAWKRCAKEARSQFESRFAPDLVNRKWKELIAETSSDGGSA